MFLCGVTWRRRLLQNGVLRSTNSDAGCDLGLNALNVLPFFSSVFVFLSSRSPLFSFDRLSPLSPLALLIYRWSMISKELHLAAYDTPYQYGSNGSTTNSIPKSRIWRSADYPEGQSSDVWVDCKRWGKTIHAFCSSKNITIMPCSYPFLYIYKNSRLRPVQLGLQWVKTPSHQLMYPDIVVSVAGCLHTICYECIMHDAWCLIHVNSLILLSQW